MLLADKRLSYTATGNTFIDELETVGKRMLHTKNKICIPQC